MAKYIELAKMYWFARESIDWITEKVVQLVIDV